MDVSIGKQNIKIMKNNVFWHKKLSKSRRLIHLCKNMIISFCNTFLQIFLRVMRHIKTKQFKEKTKNCQNREGSCIYVYIFWYPKKLLRLSMEKMHQFWTLLESGIGGLIYKGFRFLTRWYIAFSTFTPPFVIEFQAHWL